MITPVVCALFFDHNPFTPFIQLGRRECLSLAAAAHKRQLRDIRRQRAKGCERMWRNSYPSPILIKTTVCFR